MFAYDWKIESWAHQIQKHGPEAVSIGKLHFQQYQLDHGFTKEIFPMHIVEGTGDLLGLVRDELPVMQKFPSYITFVASENCISLFENSSIPFPSPIQSAHPYVEDLKHYLGLKKGFDASTIKRVVQV
jgi:hypothetical protein